MVSNWPEIRSLFCFISNTQREGAILRKWSMPQLVVSDPHERQLENTRAFEIEYNFRIRGSEIDNSTVSLAFAACWYWGRARQFLVGGLM